MARTLEQIKTALRSGTDSLGLTSALIDVVEYLQGRTNSPGADPRDAQIAELQNRVKSLQSLLDNDAATFDAIKMALGNPNLTQGQLADEIRTKWKKI